MKFKGFIVNRTQQHFVPPELSQWLLFAEYIKKQMVSIRNMNLAENRLHLTWI